MIEAKAAVLVTWCEHLNSTPDEAHYTSDE
jgi:hypothetical protein